jgi:hypothetical protein
MTDVATPAPALPRRQVRSLAARGVAGLTALVLAGGGLPLLQAPWHAVTAGTPVAHPAEHAWHVAVAAAVDLAAAAVLAAYAVRGLRTMPLAAPLAAVAAVVVLVNLPFAGPLVLILAAPFALVAALGSALRGLRSAVQAGADRVTVAITAAAAAVCLPYAVACYARQIRGVDEVAANADYASTTEHVLLLLAVLLLASTRLAGRRWLLGTTAAAGGYLAAAAAHTSGPAAPGRLAAAAIAVLALACALRAARPVETSLAPESRPRTAAAR